MIWHYLLKIRTLNSVTIYNLKLYLGWFTFHWRDSDIHPGCLLPLWMDEMDIWIPPLECKSPCLKFQIVKSDFSNPSSKHEFLPMVSSGVKILLRTFCGTLMFSRWTKYTDHKYKRQIKTKSVGLSIMANSHVQ